MRQEDAPGGGESSGREPEGSGSDSRTDRRQTEKTSDAHSEKFQNAQAKADRVQLHILLHATASGRSAEVADGLSAALKDGYGDYRFNIRSKTNNEVIIEITK